MKLLNYFLITIIILLLALTAYIYLLPKTPVAEINGHIFSLYLAKTATEQEVGLAKFNKIDNDKAMLFLFPRSDYYSFWMKNMHFPIDIIFISNDKVVDVFYNVPLSLDNDLPTYRTKRKADKVLEINAGLAKQYGIKIGTEIKIKL
jgi:uncharacterized protein